jgi:hypothetical protein
MPNANVVARNPKIFSGHSESMVTDSKNIRSPISNSYLKIRDNGPSCTGACGIPNVDDCLLLIQNASTASAESSQECFAIESGFFNDGCNFEVVSLPDELGCIPAGDMYNLMVDLYGQCIIAQDLGGCIVYSSNAALGVCVLDPNASHINCEI